jgi:hypothetical protein
VVYSGIGEDPLQVSLGEKRAVGIIIYDQKAFGHE